MDLAVPVLREEESAKPGASMEIDELPRVHLREQTGAVAGLAVEKIDPLSPYAKVLEPGMVIIEINDTPVTTRAQASAALRQGANKLRVRHEDQTDTLALVIK